MWSGIGVAIVVRLRVPSTLPWASRPYAGSRLLPLSGALTDSQVSAVIATLAQAVWRADEDVTTTLSELIEATRSKGQPARRLDGGLRLRVGGAVLNPGQGCAVAHWRSWCDPTSAPADDDRDPEWGFPPYSVEHAAGGGLRVRVHRERRSYPDRRPSRVRDGMVVNLSDADLRACLVAVEACLRGATQRIHQWVCGHAPARLAAPVAAAFAFHVGLDRDLALPHTLALPAPVVTVGCMPAWSGRRQTWLPGRPRGLGWIRLHAGMSDVDVAHVIKVLLCDNGVEAGLDLVAELSALTAMVPRPDLIRPDLTGGLIMEVGGDEQLHPDCCCSVRGWRWLLEDLDKPEADIYWGHGPTVHVKAVADGQFVVVDPHGLTRATVNRSSLAGMLVAVEADLAAATVRVGQWLTSQGVHALTGPVVALFAAAVGLPTEAATRTGR